MTREDNNTVEYRLTETKTVQPDGLDRHLYGMLAIVVVAFGLLTCSADSPLSAGLVAGLLIAAGVWAVSLLASGQLGGLR